MQIIQLAWKPTECKHGKVENKISHLDINYAPDTLQHSSTLEKSNLFLLQDFCPESSISKPWNSQLLFLITQDSIRPSGFLFLFVCLFVCLAVLGLRCFAWAFSSCGKRGLFFAVVRWLLTAVASLVAEHRLQVRRLQQLWLAGSRAQAQQLWCTGLAAPRHMGSSRTRDQTRVPCIGRQILNHCTTREEIGRAHV